MSWAGSDNSGPAGDLAEFLRAGVQSMWIEGSTRMELRLKSRDDLTRTGRTTARLICEGISVPALVSHFVSDGGAPIYADCDGATPLWVRHREALR